jgi:DNA polymerase III psi subunit
MSATNALELRIMQMRIWALVAAERIDGQRTVSLARHGDFEVRLIELPQDPQSDDIPLWIELFEHVNSTTLDSCSGHDLAHIAVAAEAFISQARDLHRALLAFAPLTASGDVSGD